MKFLIQYYNKVYFHCTEMQGLVPIHPLIIVNYIDFPARLILLNKNRVT